MKATVKVEHTDPSNRKVLHLELVSSDLDSETGKEKTSIPGDAYYWGTDPIRGHEFLLEAIFDVPVSFGPIGAVLVENEVDKKMFLINIVVSPDNNESASVTFEGNSWIKPKSGDTVKHVFFPLKYSSIEFKYMHDWFDMVVQSYLPSETPPGVESLRDSELKATSGDGSGARNKWDRIYDYEVYNDLSKPDIDDNLTRPVLGGDVHPYPRRCRTGRLRSDKDPSSEKAGNYVYVPKDEVFSPSDELEFLLNKGLMSPTPGLWTMLDTKSLSFPSFTAINSLFDDTVVEQPPSTEFPFVSKLDEKEYGPRESGLTKELIEEQIGQAMTVEEAVEKKKLFMLDYHDMLLPFVNDVRELDGTTLYGSRTLFFLTEQGTLRPIAIELTRPKGKPPILAEAWSQVFTPQQWDGTGSWVWKLAKAHVLAHDSGYHQLVNHWLRTHCCVEPYIIAANRQLSRMHPIFRLLHPHFRYTMQINAKSREKLINADGIIERAFSPGRYSMMLSSAAYKEHWRFDMEALPADLIRRGMAVEEEDGTLTLTIKDYPYANDGLLVWESIKEWTSDYVKHYYSSAADVTGDKELNGWWDEVRTQGHADKKDEPWWPKLDSRESLVQVLTSIMWVTSGHHAAVNFAQYPLAGYFLNRPTIARKKMPVEEGPDRAEHMADFRAKPEKELLEVFPSQFQAVLVMTVLHVLSSHWPDEQHMGRHMEPAWEADPIIKSAFEKLQDNMLKNEGIIDERNEAEDLKNRCGAGVMPYELFKRSSGAGDTGKGLPYSISI
ncbi:hypothetical protein ACQ4PT_046611 [Festuca glaucescens]